MADSTNINDKPASQANKLENRQASQISSLSAFTVKMQEQTKKDIKSMDKRIESIMRYQAMTKKRSEYAAKALDTSVRSNRELSSSTSKILGSMNESIRQLAIGTKKITTATAISSRDLISQYGKAISEDISYNKQNMVATSLAQASPIFGYFAAKFMETDVFKDAASKIKFSLGSAIKDAFLVSKGMARSLGEKVSDIFTRTPKIEYSEESRRYLGDVKIAAKDLKEHVTKLKLKKPLEKAQTGGYVNKSGAITVHKGEVITPIEKLPKIVEAINKVKNTSSESAGSIKSLINIMAENSAKMEEYVGEQQRTNRTIMQSFITGYKEASTPGNKSWQERMLKATLEMKIAMVGMSSRMRIAWQRVLTEHPLFKNLLGAFEIFKTGIFVPIKFLFGMRGGYRKYLPKGSNQFQNISQILNITFVQQMDRLDKIVFYLRTISTGVVGEDGKALEKKYEEEKKAKSDEYSLYSQLKDFMTGKKKEKEDKNWKQRAFDRVVSRMGLDEEALRQAGFDDIFSLLSPKKVLKSAGVTRKNVAERVSEKIETIRTEKENIAEKVRQAAEEKKEKASPGINKAKEYAEKSKEYAQTAKEKTKEYTTFGIDKIKDIFSRRKEKGREYASSKPSRAKEYASSGLGRVKSIFGRRKEFASTAAGKAGEYAGDAKEFASTAAGKAGEYAGDTKDQAASIGRSVLKFFGFGLSLEENMYKAQVKHQDKLLKRELKHQKRLQSQQDNYEKDKKKKRLAWIKFDKKTIVSMKENYTKYLTKFNEKQAKFTEVIANRTTRLVDFKTKLAKESEEKISKIKQKGEETRDKISLRLFKKGLRLQEKISEKWNKKIRKANDKSLDKQAAKTNKIYKKHRTMMNWILNRQKNVEKKKLKQMTKLETMNKKLENKRNKQYKKIENLKKKMEQRRQAWETKLQTRKDKYKMKQELRAAKLEGRLKFIKEKIKMKRRSKIEKLRDKKLRAKMKIDEALAKGKLKREMKKMKQQIKDSKVQMKKEEKKLKAELKAARKEEWAQRKQMIKERFMYALDTGKRFKAFMRKTDANMKTRIQLAKDQISKLNKIKGLQVKVVDGLSRGFNALKRAGKSIWKWLFIGLGFIKDVVFAGISKLGPLLSSAIGMAFGGAKSLAGGAWRAAGSGIGGAAARLGIGRLAAGTGIGGALIGGYMMIKDAMGGVKKAKEWGTSKIGAGIGGALGGTGKGWGGAGRGALKGAAVGTAIGMIGGPIGMAIGGAIGAIAGGILGAIGGKNIAKAMDWMGTKIKKLVKGVYNFITYPYRLMWKLIKRTYVELKESYEKGGAWGLAKTITNKITKLMLAPIYLPLKLAMKITDWASKKFGFEEKWNKVKSVVEKAITSPIDFVIDMIKFIGTKIREYTISAVEKIPVIGKYLADKLKTKETAASPTTKIEVGPGIAEKIRSKEENELIRSRMLAGEKIPGAQVGGYVTKSGLVRLHAGEIISPISDDIKDKVEKAITNGSDIAKKTAINDTAKTKFMIKEQAKAQKEAIGEFIKSNNVTTAAVINNITTSMTNSMQSMSNNLGSQDRGHFDSLARQILEGDIS